MADFLFLDLETTGLDPAHCRIAEVACALTKDDFEPYAWFRGVCNIDTDPDAGPARGNGFAIWEPVAWRMHNGNGLLEDIRTAYGPVYSPGSTCPVGEDLFRFLAERLGNRQANLAGNSIHFDRSFILRAWPRVAWFLTHRHLDVSSLRLAGMAQGRPKFEGEPAHRALADVRASLAELHYWLTPPAVSA